MILTEEQDEYPLGLYLEILKDPTRQLTIEEVTTPEFDGKFIPNKSKVLNPGFVNSVYWIRFQVNNQTHQACEWWLEIAGFEISASLYYLSPYDLPGFEMKHAGWTHSTAKGNKTYHYYPVFHLPLASDSKQTIYLRIDGQRMNLPLTLWSSAGFIRKSQKDFIIKGCYLGILLIMSVYNLFLFFALHDKSYLYYVLFLICALLAVILRHIQANLTIQNIMHAFATLMVLFLLRFTGSFLMAKVHAPRLNRILNGLQIGMCVTGLLFIVSSWAILFNLIWIVLVMFCLAVIFTTSLVSWRRGYRPARYFVLAQTILLGTFFFQILAMIGYAPITYTEYIIPMAVSLMAVLMSLALADRINTIKKERELAEKDLKKHHDHLEELVKARTVELETANEELESFAYSVSHDLRAPLRHINGFVDLLKINLKNKLDTQGKHHMDIIGESAKKMEELIDNLLNFSRMGRQSMLIKKVHMDKLINNVIKEIESDLSGRNIKWQIDSMPIVDGDLSMLKIVLINLISNAVKFTRSRKQAHIHINSKYTEKETIVFVKDNGVGFDPDYTQNLFGVFQRLHREEDFEGTGLGLAIAYRIVHRHGGRIWAEGKLDKGATVYFSLPCTDVTKSKSD